MDEYTYDAWFDLLGDLTLADCRTAVITVAKRQPFVAASEIRAEVRRANAAQAERQRSERVIAPARRNRDELTDPRPLRSTIRELLAAHGRKVIGS